LQSRFLLDHARKVALRLDVLTDTVVSRSLLEERVLDFSGQHLGLRHDTHLWREGRGEGTKSKNNWKSYSAHTFAAFLLAPAFPCGKGAGAGFFPLGGYH
jgi:hypothetical protein